MIRPLNIPKICRQIADPPTSVDVSLKEKCVECPRYFYFIHADPGQGNHSLGNGLKAAANTHKMEIENGTFPFDVPTFRSGIDKSVVMHINRVKAFKGLLEAHKVKGDVHYVSIFSHMGAGGFGYKFENDYYKVDYARTGLVFFGDASEPDTNMGEVTYAELELKTENPEIQDLLKEITEDDVKAALIPALIKLLNTNNTSPKTLPKEAFYPDAATQIRLFGCYGATGENGDSRQWSIAEALHDHLGINTYGYGDTGGSMMTDDKQLGHGKRSPTKNDQSRTKMSDRGDLWFVPFVGKMEFTKF